MTTDTERPAFPYHSAELSSQLGLPEHPAVHLAVATLADRLGDAAARSHTDPRIQRIAALRAASAAVLFSWTIEAAQRYAADEGVDLPFEVWWPEEKFGVKAVDWLGQAMERLQSEGIDPGPDARRMKTRYGWDERRLDAG